LLASVLAIWRKTDWLLFDGNDDATGKMFEVAGRSKTKHSLSWKAGVMYNRSQSSIPQRPPDNLNTAVSDDTSGKAAWESPMHETLYVVGRGTAQPKDGDFRMRPNEK
jgi:hypothetical protein